MAESAHSAHAASLHERALRGNTQSLRQEPAREPINAPAHRETSKMTPLEAHARLLKRLTVREHRIGDDSPKPPNPGDWRPVMVNGRYYSSMTRAAATEGITMRRLRKMIEDKEGAMFA